MESADIRTQRKSMRQPYVLECPVRSCRRAFYAVDFKTNKLIAAIYGVFILLMCWRANEGDYLPPGNARTRWSRPIVSYFREFFGESFFWWMFLAYSVLGWSCASNVFSIFFYPEQMGFSLDLVGKLNAWSSALSLVLSYLFGMLLDRYGIWTVAGTLPIASLALLKWTVDFYPPSHYGQFGSDGALFSSIGGMILGPFFTWLINGGADYRCFLLWSVGFTVVGVYIAYAVWRKQFGHQLAQVS